MRVGYFTQPRRAINRTGNLGISKVESIIAGIDSLRQDSSMGWRTGLDNDFLLLVIWFGMPVLWCLVF